jgi:hypothetical protein
MRDYNKKKKNPNNNNLSLRPARVILYPAVVV